MRDLIIFGVLYVVMLGAFHWLGSLVAAGSALEGWGRRATHV